jgi:hypothetical protein
LCNLPGNKASEKGLELSSVGLSGNRAKTSQPAGHVFSEKKVVARLLSVKGLFYEKVSFTVFSMFGLSAYGEWM